MPIRTISEITHENTGKLEIVYHFDEPEEGLWIHDTCVNHSLPVFPRRSTIEHLHTNFVRVLINKDTDRMILKLSL